MEEWKFIYLLHNMWIREPVETEYIKIVPADHPMTTELRNSSKSFSQFVDNFTSHSRRKYHPSILFYKTNEKPDFEEIISFRNILALSSITLAWQNTLNYNSHNENYKFSNYFDFYPVSLCNDGIDLIEDTDAVRGFDGSDTFKGQISPGIILDKMSDFYDDTLFNLLYKKWTYHYKNKIKEFDYSLFNSLEMAYRAARLPVNNRGTLYDYGSGIALWVSAIEILFHPGGDSDISFNEVQKIFSNIKFHSIKLSYRKFKGRHNNNVTLIQKIYTEMYSVRNKFLHGNPVNIKDIFFKRDKKYYTLNIISPLIYKCALYYYLGMYDYDESDFYDIFKYASEIGDLEDALQKINEPSHIYLHNKRKKELKKKIQLKKLS